MMGRTQKMKLEELLQVNALKAGRPQRCTRCPRPCTFWQALSNPALLNSALPQLSTHCFYQR